MSLMFQGFIFPNTLMQKMLYMTGQKYVGSVKIFEISQ